VVVSASLGPARHLPEQSFAVLPVLLWVILLFAASAGLPRGFVQEEETHTATALRLAAKPSTLFAGKLLYGLTLLFALETLVTPVYCAMVSLTVKSPGLLALTLAVAGYGLAAGKHAHRRHHRPGPGALDPLRRARLPGPPPPSPPWPSS